MFNRVGGAECATAKNAPIPPTGSCAAFIYPRMLELIYTAVDMRPFAEECGYSSEPFRWNEDRRFVLRCELDALFFGLYLGWTEWSPCPNETSEQLAQLRSFFPSPRDAVDYILDTFPIVRGHDEKQHGSYRTKETILKIFDQMCDAITTAIPFTSPFSVESNISTPMIHKTSTLGSLDEEPDPSFELVSDIQPEKTMTATDEQTLRRVFCATHEGASPDRLIIDPDLRGKFLDQIRREGIQDPEADIFHHILNLRKQGRFQIPDVRCFSRPPASLIDSDYITEWAVRLTQEQLKKDFHVTCSLDRILCDPEMLSIFDTTVRKLREDTSCLHVCEFELRLAALRVRKRSLKSYYWLYDDAHEHVYLGNTTDDRLPYVSGMARDRANALIPEFQHFLPLHTPSIRMAQERPDFIPLAGLLNLIL